MKTFVKPLSLMLAGILAATALASCTSTAPQATESADATSASATTAAPITEAPSACLAPAQLMRKMKDATEMTFRYTMLYEVYGKEHEFTSITNLKNGRVMRTVINQDPYGNRSEVKTYYDLNNALHYEKNENGKWTATATDAKWEAIVNGFGLAELLDPGSMKKKGDHYGFSPAKTREWRDNHGFDGDASITLTEKDGVHILRIEFLNNSNGDDQTETYTIEFQSDAVRLPTLPS